MKVWYVMWIPWGQSASDASIEGIYDSRIKAVTRAHDFWDEPDENRIWDENDEDADVIIIEAKVE